MSCITVDFDNHIGKIKPFHGINNAPIVGSDTKLYLLNTLRNYEHSEYIV